MECNFCRPGTSESPRKNFSEKALGKRSNCREGKRQPLKKTLEKTGFTIEKRIRYFLIEKRVCGSGRRKGETCRLLWYKWILTSIKHDFKIRSF
ncbi:hypothetical protein [Methanosarcina mazei]|uniref:hypothetical protein n=1 Tax=Methanosarcina mazei TaxID=2209 RepID=UPI003C774D6B